MRNRIQRYLAAVERGRVSADFRGQGVRALMARRREQENDVPNYAKN